jgi:proteic killer suppression protein
VRLRFDDSDLQRLCADASFSLSGTGPEVTSAFRKKVGYLGQANSQQDIRAMKSFHLEKLKGRRGGQHAIRLNMRWRLILRFEEDEDGPLIAIVEIVDYH